MKFSSIALIAAVAGVADAFAPAPQSSTSSVALSMSLEKYSDELKATAAAMVQEGKGLLACDESTGTVGTRLESIGLENNEANRREVRILNTFLLTSILLCSLLYQFLTTSTFPLRISSHRISSGASFFSPPLISVTAFPEQSCLRKRSIKILRKVNPLSIS